MSKQEVIIVGAAGHAKVIIDIFEKEGSYDIIGLLDSNGKRKEKILGHSIIGKEEDLPNLLQINPGCQIFIAIGDNWVRSVVKEKICSLVPNAFFANAIHPLAVLGKDVKLGHGIAIMAGAVINSDTILGDFVIVNTKASLDHDSRLSKFSSLAPNVTTGGGVSIGEYTAISISATIKHGISVGNHTVIGANSLLLHHCGDNAVCYGIPAKEIRKRAVGEKYL